jgi:diguanylate cyclase
VEAAHATTWHDESRLARTITWMAAAFALFVALAAPLGYLWLAVSGEAKEATIAARLHAAFVTQVVSSSADWRRDVAGLIETDLAPGALPEVRSILDLSHVEVARSGPDVASPTLQREAPLLGREGPVGTVKVTRSLRPVLWVMVLVGVLSSALGSAIFATLRVLPLRSLKRTLQALAVEQGRARREAEQRLSIVFDNSVEGIMTLLPSGVVLTCNDAAARLFNESPLSLVGRRLVELIGPPTVHDVNAPFTVGHFESIGKRHGGEGFPVEMTVSETRLTGKVQLIAIVRDITERKQTQERLSHLANFDALTGLPNRRLFRERLEQAMERARRSGAQMALMFLDLDRFKDINDSLGHDVGDRLLRHVSHTLSHGVRRAKASDSTEPVTVARLGGDEFTLIVEGLAGAEDAAHVARRILERLHEPFRCDGSEIFASASIGITLYPRDATDLDALIRHADLAMYRAKELGRNTFHFFTEELNNELSERLSLEMNLRHALDRSEFALVYQPKASLRNGRVTGVEALLRWQRPGHDTIGPDRFIPVLEETGLILPVGAWVLEQACRQLAAWDGEGLPPLKMAVNLSPRQFAQRDLPQLVERALRDAGIAPQRLELELTESLLMNDETATLAMLAALRTMGVGIAIDDFGTGHSSLAYLKRFDVETLKIDRTFVRDTPDDPEDNAITSAVIALGHSLGLSVVAEGVENLAQSEFLRDLGCDEIQGYLLSRPMAPALMPGWLTNYRDHVASRLGSGFGTDQQLPDTREGAAAPRLATVSPLRRPERKA